VGTHLTGLSARLVVALSATAQRAIDLATPNAKIGLERVIDFAFGAGAEKADLLWWDRRPIAKGADDDLKLTGVLVDGFGETLSFGLVKAILVVNRSDEATAGAGVGGADHPATDAKIRIGGAASAEFQGPFAAAGDAIVVPAGGAFTIFCRGLGDWMVTPTLVDVLGVTDLDADDEALYDIVLLGESA